jgi:hypothetical protein
VTVADEAHDIPLARLRQIFGADAALYITINRYGVSYRLIDSVVETSASARLIDLRDGRELWRDSVHIAVGNDNNSGGGLAGMLLNAVLSQIVNSATDRAHTVAGAASHRLLSIGKYGLPHGPYHPAYNTD